MAQGGFSIFTKVADVVNEDGWKWPVDWNERYPTIGQLNRINLDRNKQDVIVWKDLEGNLVDFSTRTVWNTIRVREQPVNWYSVIWSPFSVPRHAFHCWLICKGKLWTQDRIRERQYRAGYMNMMCCLLCQKALESHNHLFFECDFSMQVWLKVRNKAYMDNVQGEWVDVLQWLIAKSSSKSAKSVIGKLLVAACAYFIWQERNSRFFNNQRRPPDEIVQTIFSTTRMKLHSFKFKDTPRVREIKREWKIEDSEVLSSS